MKKAVIYLVIGLLIASLALAFTFEPGVYVKSEGINLSMNTQSNITYDNITVTSTQIEFRDSIKENHNYSISGNTGLVNLTIISMNSTLKNYSVYSEVEETITFTITNVNGKTVYYDGSIIETTTDGIFLVPGNNTEKYLEIKTNSAPVVENVILNSSESPDNPYTTNNLYGYCNASDLDSDTLTYYYEWWNGTSLYSSGNDSGGNTESEEVLVDILSSIYTSKAENWIFTCIANDGIINSTKTNSSSLTINNSVPTQPTDITGFPANLYVGNTLTVTASGSTDLDEDDLTYYYEFYNVDDATIRQSYSTTNSYTIQQVDKQDTIRVRTKAYDGALYSSEYTEDDEVENRAPTTISSRISPDYADNFVDLEGYCNASDLDSDTLTYYYEWWNGTSLYSSGNDGGGNTESEEVLVNTLDSSITSNTETWYFTCRAYDSLLYGDKTNSTGVYIDNSIPTEPTDLTGFPANLYVGNTLTVTASGSTDLDEDPITYYYEFYNVDDATIRQAYSTTNSYTIQQVDKRDTIRVRTLASDGTDNSSVYTEDDEVENRAPTTPTSITGFPANLYVGNTLTVTASGSTDADSDSITYYYEFYNVDDATIRQAYSTTNSYTIQQVDKRDTIRVRTKAYDGALYSSEYTEDDEVENRNPSLNKTNVTSVYIDTDEDMIGYCKGDDIDKDDLTFYYRWYNDSIIYQENSNTGTNQGSYEDYQNTLSNTITDVGENWTFSCLVSDGVINTSWANSSTKYIYDITYSARTLSENNTNHNDRTWIYMKAITTSPNATGAYVYLYDPSDTLINTTYFDLSALSNKSIEINFTELGEGEYQYNTKYEFEVENFTLNNLTQFFDSTPPTITQYGPDFTERVYNQETITFSYNISDANLFGYNFTCYDDENNIEITQEETGLATTQEEVNISKRFTSAGDKVCNMTVADDHTANEIDFEVKKNKGFLNFGKEKIEINDEIKIIPQTDIESLSWETERDRIKPIIKLKKPGSYSEYVGFSYEIDIGKMTAFKRDSEYQGHYVILSDNLEKSYWIDSENNLENAKINDYIDNDKIIYDVEASWEDLEKHDWTFKTDSIGGINIVIEEDNFTVYTAQNITVSGYNVFNSSNVDINVSVDNGINVTNYTGDYTYEVLAPCNETNMTITSLSYMNNYSYNITGCGYLDLNVSFWESELNIFVKGVASGEFLDSVNLNFTLDSFSNQTIIDKNHTFYINNGTYNVTASSPFLYTTSVTGYIDEFETINRTINMSSEYNASVVREQTGENFDFLELVNQSTCTNGTYNQTIYNLQEDANSYSCANNWSTTNTCADTYDGLYSTYGQSEIGGNATVYINYSKPSEANNDSYWYIRKDFLSYKRYNMSDYEACWNESKLKFRIDSNESTSSTSYFCHNGSEWQKLNTFTNNGEVYEESMYWATTEEVTNTTSCNQYEDVEVTIKTFCPDRVIINKLNSTNNKITNIDCEYDYWYMLVQYQETSYSRTAIPDPTDLTPKLYLLDLQKDVAVQVILIVRDLNDDYRDGKVRLYKYVNDSRVVVLEQLLDIENRVVLWLDKDELYEAYIVNDQGEESFLGDLIADQAGTKYVTLPKINILSTADTPNDVTFSYTDIDRDAGTISFYYDDNSANGPNLITWRILKEETGQIVYENTTTSRNFVMTADELNTHYTYYTDLTIDHNDYGEISEYRPIWYGSATVFEGWGDTETKYAEGATAWANNTAYTKNDKVTYGGSVYRAITTHISTAEPNESASFRDYPTNWEAGVSYQKLDVVTYPANTQNDYLVTSDHVSVIAQTPDDTPTIYEVLKTRENETSEIVKLIIAILVPLLMALVFSQSTAEIGMTVSLIMMALFQSFHWYTYLTNATVVGETIVTIIIGLFGIIAFWMWTRKARREE